MTGFVSCVKILGLNPEGDGVLNSHLWVIFEFQGTHPGCTVEGGLGVGQSSVQTRR